MQQDQEIYEETLKDKLTMGPVDKYEKYGRFPWKYILQLLLIAGTSYQVRVVCSQNAQNSRNLLYTINEQVYGFSNFDYVYYTDDSPQTSFTMYYSLTDYYEDVLQLFEVMGSLDEILFPIVDQDAISSTINTMKVYYRTPLNEQYANISQYEFTLLEPPFNLADQATMKSFLRQVAKYTLTFNNIQFRGKTTANIIESWTVMMTYTVTDLQTIVAELDATMTQLSDGATHHHSYQWFTHLFVFVVAMMSLLLHIKYLFDMVWLYTQTKLKSTRYVLRKEQSFSINVEQQQDWEQSYLNPSQQWMDQFDMRGHKKITKIIQTQKPWNMLTLEEKLLFLDAWVFVTIVGNILQSFTSMVLMINLQSLPLSSTQYLIGFSCFFAWMAICRYVEYQENVYILTYLLKYSLPTILRFILGVMPFFIGYAILGLTLFYRVLYFANFQRAFVSLICLSYGNMLYELAFFLGENFAATIFVITYSVIFLLVFQNICMTIFVVMVYDKFDALLKQDMFDYLLTKIPNLHELLDAAGKDKSQLSQRTIPQKASPHASPQPSPNQYPIFLKNVYSTKIKLMSKKIEKSIQRMQSDLQDDLKIFLITQKNDKQYVKQMNEVCLEHLLKRSQYIIRRSEKIEAKLKTV